MNSIHDMGGMHGFGPVAVEENEPVFHAAWERRAFAIGNLATAAFGNSVGQKRHAQERMGNALYLNSSYYERWMSAVEAMAVGLGAVIPEELADGRIGTRDVEPVYKLAPERVGSAMRKGRITRRDQDIAPRYTVGEAVRTVNTSPTGHTRLPRYARAKTGKIERDQGVFVFADSLGNGGGEAPQRVYSVRFEGLELWGPGSPPNQAVYLDLFESYLEPV